MGLKVFYYKKFSEFWLPQVASLPTTDQLFCGVIVWAPLIQELIIWGVITSQAMFWGAIILEGTRPVLDCLFFKRTWLYF